MENILPGFWYLNKNHKKDIKNLKILTTEIYHSSISNKKIIEINKSYSKFLIELSTQLNIIHKKDWPSKTWEIIIGSWLRKYITVISNRLQIVEYLIKKNKKFYFINFKKKKKICLNTYNINEFIEEGLKDYWNEEIFNRFYNFRKNKKKIDIINLKKETKENKSLLKLIQNIVLNKIFKIYNYFFCTNSQFVFHKPYFGKKFEFFKFIFSLKEFPHLYILDNSKIDCKFDLKKRKKIKFSKSNNILEYLIKGMAIECIPRIYIEGFSEVMQRVKNSSLPTKKTVIYTSNLHNDSTFKFWTAKQKNNGSKLIMNQHGSGHGFFKFEEKNNFYNSITDLMLTWGHSGEKNKGKIKRFSIINHKIFPEKKFTFKPGLSIIMNNYENYIMAADHNTMRDIWKSNENKCYYEMKMIEIFLNSLKSNIRKKIVLRPHPKKNKRVNTLFFENKYKDIIKINDDYRIDILDFLRSFSINIIPEFHSTSFAFAMAKNFPVITFFPHSKNYLNSSTKKIHQSLVNASICHTSAKSASNFINKTYNNPEKWWYSKKTQDARKKYCNRFARVISNRKEKLKEILLEQKKKLLKEF